MLAACNSKAELVNKQNGSDNKEKSGLTLMEVFEKTTEASKDLKSFKVKMDIKQNIQDEGENMKINSTLDMDVVQNPMAFHQIMSMNQPDSNETMKMESFFSRDGMYLHDPTTNSWMKFPDNMMEQLLKVSDQQTNPMAEIEKLRKFVDDIKFKQDDHSYILLLNASGDKFMKFLKEEMQKTLPAGMDDSAKVFENMKISKMDYEIHIDKKTFFPSVLNLNMVSEMTTEGKTIKMAQELKGQYEKHNQIDNITIPQEVVEGAVEVGL